MAVLNCRLPMVPFLPSAAHMSWNELSRANSPEMAMEGSSMIVAQIVVIA